MSRKSKLKITFVGFFSILFLLATFAFYHYVYAVSDPVINSPVSAGHYNSSSWSPSVSWGDADQCYYDYDGGNANTSVDCSNGGSDIPLPGADGDHVLYVRGYSTGEMSSSGTVSVSFNHDTTPPSYSSGNTVGEGTTVTLTFDESLDSNSVGSTNGFSVSDSSANNCNPQVTAAQSSGTNVVLTLSCSLRAGGIVSVSYDYGLIQWITDQAGNVFASSISDSVTNNTETTAPAISSAATDVSGGNIVLTYDESMDSTGVPSNGAFTVSGDPMTSVEGVSVSGSEVTLDLTSSIGIGETVYISYSSGASATRLRDLAGNEAGDLTSYFVTNNVLTVTETPTISGVTTDTGANSSDAVTSDTTLTISGTSIPDDDNSVTIRIYVNSSVVGTTNPDSGGSWSFDRTFTAGSSYSVGVSAQETGYAESSQAGITVTVDTSVSAPGTPDMTSNTDTGRSSTDNITNDTTPTFTVGSCETGATVTLKEGLTELGSATCGVGITTSALSAGPHSITSSQVDLAGNSSSNSAALSITIDTTAPVISSIASSTSAATATVSWLNDEAASSTVQYGLTTSYGSAVSSSSTSTAPSLSISGLTSSTLYHYKIFATDVAGNTSSSSDQTFLTAAPPDTTAPTISNVTSDKADGAYTVGEVIDIDVIFSEAVTSTGNVTVTLETGTTDQTCMFTVTASSSATCSYTVQSGDSSADLTVSSISGTIADGSSNQMVSFTPATNLAANKALVIDTQGPSLSLDSPLDDAAVSGVITPTATASDAQGVSGVSFYIDDVIIGVEDTSSPFSTSLDTALLTNGAYEMYAVGRDSLGNTSTTSSISITISNSQQQEDDDNDDGNSGRRKSSSRRSSTLSGTTPNFNSNTNTGTSGVSNVTTSSETVSVPTYNTIDEAEAVVTTGVPQVIYANPTDIARLPNGKILVIPSHPSGYNPQGVVLAAVASRNLTVTSRGEEVRMLQIYLNTHGFPLAESGPGSFGQETDYFGELTKKALMLFQAAFGIDPTGFFGWRTREMMSR